MEGLPAIIETARLPLEIPIRPCLRDHRFEGRAVLPAVEAMEALARAAARFDPHTPVDAMTGLSFDKFLALAPDADRIEAFCDFTRHDNGELKAVLATRTAVKRAALTRVKEHAAVIFPRPGPLAGPAPAAGPVRAPEAGGLRLTGAGIYPELVPFGPFYRNVVGVRANARGAVAEIRTPVEDPGAESAPRLGSPFALDAAFHAACVWGQRFAGIVAFPVGMGRRRVHAPTRPGEAYVAHVTPVRADGGILVFDLRITGRDGRLHEACAGIRMRDVSGGRLKPPSWVMALACRAEPYE